VGHFSAGGVLRVVFLNTSGGASWGGVETWMLSLAEHLVEEGHEAISVGRPGSRWAERCRSRGLPTLELAMSGDFGPRGVWGLSRLFLQDRPHVVVVKSRRGIRMAWAARLLAPFARPVILCRLGTHEDAPSSLRAALTFRYMGDAFIVPSQYTLEHLPRWLSSSGRPIRVIPNGVELPELGEETRRTARAQLGLGASSQVVITTSRLHPTKGHEYLLEAFASVAERFPNARLVIAGDGAKRGSLEAKATHLLGAGRVLFTGFRRDVTPLLAASDLFVLPSLLEGMPHSLLEAMAAGLPVVATSVCGIPEVVEHGRNGLLVPPRDAVALASAICRILGEPELADRLAKEARATIEQKFAVRDSLDEAIQYMHELVARAV